MFGVTAFTALAVSLAILPRLSTQTDLRFCKDGTCPADDAALCPVVTSDLGTGYPICAIFNSDALVGGKDFAAAEGGGYEVFLDISQPDPGCTVIIRSPASVDEPECGLVVGAFKNAGCVKVTLKETFLTQFCCGSGDCAAAGVGKKKMVRGLNYARGGVLTGGGFRNANGAAIAPIAVGEPPEWKSTWRNDRRRGRRSAFIAIPPQPEGLKLPPASNIDKENPCKYTPEGDIFTKPGALQLVLTGVDGGTAGSEVKITQARSVSRSTTFEAGVSFEVFSASVSVTFEETITDGQEKTFNIPAGQVGKLGFTPTLKCTRGSVDCGEGIKSGEACTGFREAGEVAGTYAVVAVT